MSNPSSQNKNKRTRKGTMNPKPRSECGREHDFTLVLTDPVEMTREIQDALFVAGCDDATLSVRGGRAYLTFSRVAPTLKDAILSAIRDVKKADIGVGVLRVDVCNLVTQAEIAKKIGRSRQMVHQYITGARGPGNFPAPACNITDGIPLWFWCEVAYWLRQNDMISQDAATEAQEAALVNTVLEMQYHRRIDPTLCEEILKSLVDEPMLSPGRKT
jgi:hypothetical protein